METTVDWGEIERLMGSTDLAVCGGDRVARLLGLVRAGKRRLDGFEARLARAAQWLQDTGSGSPVEEVLGADGEVSRAEAKRRADRAGVGDTLARVGADGLRDLADPPTDLPSRAERQRAASRLALGRGRDGMWWLSATFDPERGAELAEVINQLARHLAGPDPLTANTRADALHRLVTNPSGDTGLTAPLRMGIGYIVDAHTMAYGPHEHTVAQTWAGDDVEPRTVTRHACDAECYAVLVDRFGQPGPVGRTRRAATRHQRLQLRALYDACPLDATPFDRCEIHHVNLPWEHQGDTEIDNLLPLSPRWHHRIHDRGWHLEMHPDRSLTLHRPDGTIQRRLPPPTPLTRQHC